LPVRLFGPLHSLLLSGIVTAAVALSLFVRRSMISGRAVRLLLGYGLAVNEIVWWIFRYSHEGFRFPINLPLQLCDVVVWSTVAACLTTIPLIVEFSYFAGLAGAGMAVLTPDLWSPWPSYPAIYFFVAHGGIIIAVSVLVFGRLTPLRPRAAWRVFGLLLIYVGFLSGFNAVFGTNYMYLCRKPRNASLLNVLGPWPVYLCAGATIALALFWLLWLAARAITPGGGRGTASEADSSRSRSSQSQLGRRHSC